MKRLTLSKRSVRAPWLGLLLLAPALGCEAIAGIEDRTLFVDPAQSQGGAGGGGSAGAAGDGGASGLGGMSGAAGDSGNAGVAGSGAGAAGDGGAAGDAGAAGEGGAGNAGDGGTSGAAGDAGSAGSAGDGGAAGNAGGTTCNFTTGSGTGIRVANLVPSLARYDVCIKPKAATDYAGVKPAFRGGAGCPNGLGYKQVSAGIDVLAGIYDVKFLSEGATDCSDPGVFTLETVSVKTGSFADAFLLGDAADVAPYAFSESGPAAQYNTAFRFMHVAKGVEPIDVVLTDTTEPPATYSQFLFQGLGYNTLPTSSPFEKVDANGYLQIALFGSKLNIGVDSVGGSGARLVRPTVFASDAVLSMFLVGTPSDPRYPQELLLCDALQNDPATPYLALCNGGQSFKQPVRLGTFNTALTGVFAPNEAERRPEVIKAIAAADVDVLCTSELWAQADKQAIKDAAKGKFPHQYSFQSDEKTPLYEAKAQNGEVPPAYTDPPCGAADLAKLNTLVDCVKAKCSTDPTSEEATTIPGTCASSAQGCQGSFATLLFGNKNCYACALDHLQSYQTMASTRDACANQTDQRYTYQGDNPQLVLSKLPIVESEAFLLPASEWRVAVLRTTLKLANDSLFDVYCTTLTTPVDSLTRPYVGQYGDGKSGIAAWNAENKYQTQLLAQLVKEKSAYRRAVVLGELYAGPDAKDGATQILDPYTPESWQVLQSNFGVGVAPGHKPACTYCSTNPLVGGKLNYWASHLLTHNISITDASDTKILFTEAFIPATIGEPPTPSIIPLSRHYSLSSVLLFDP